MDLKLHISAYDINCQYRIHFDSRMAEFQELQEELEELRGFRCDCFPTTQAGIGKLHIPAHTLACRYKYSMHWLPGSAMTDGEAAERIWSVLNHLSLRTREMNAGHRHDVINEYHNDQNLRRTHQLARELTRKYTVAVKQRDSAVQTVENLEVTVTKHIGSDELAGWKRREEEWKVKVVDRRNHKDLDNPYELTKSKALSQKDALAELRENIVQGSTEDSLVGTIEEGVALQEMK
ncbi:hypothetical protein PHLCEN_2v4818 [Hermanssonia centrifuga]|uniref:Uncharacterized protein n=1 Tax=Hermanssonia centrifuga TaxID=98765 RepID=A0A2R6PGG5_9APHY|nr:hypothetical protein PHLCEN_2v4818 [Hermanssonia centrifuga]